MKHSRVTAGSFVAVLSPLAGIAASLAGALPAWGGDVPFTEHVIMTAMADTPYSVFATDVDGDGNTDVLSAFPGSFWDWGGKIAWYESDGGSPPNFTERVISSTGDAPISVFATDVDGDGDTDVLSASFLDHKIAWYESDGGSPPNFTEHVISTAADNAYSVFATDVDSDGDIDILSASIYDDKIAWYESDGGSPPNFTERVISTNAATAGSVFATDVDGDGNTDVLSASDSDDKIAWYESDGGSPPSFTERVISTTADGAWSVFATDVDRDGDTDVLSASWHDDKIAWYENVGGSPPNFTERVISTAADQALSVFATDVDGDGDIDVLSASRGDGKLAWYENTAPPCGNGSIDPGEECDGGLGCTDCLCDTDFEPTVPPSLYCQAICGNGSIDPGEECDDGLDNSDTEPDACRTDCRQAWCGDGVVDAGEECDDGPDNSDTEPDACRTTCMLPSCGDGVVDPGEDCDDGVNHALSLCNACQAQGSCCYATAGYCEYHLVEDMADCRGEWSTTQECYDELRELYCEKQVIPTISEWGLLVLSLLLLVGIGIKFGRRRWLSVRRVESCFRMERMRTWE